MREMARERSHGGFREGYPWACFTLGKPVLGQRVWDLLRCLDYLQSRQDVDKGRIHGLGERAAALAVLLSGVLDDRLHSVLLDHPIATYRSIVESKAYSLELSWFLFDVLKHFDLPDLTALLYLFCSFRRITVYLSNKISSYV